MIFTRLGYNFFKVVLVIFVFEVLKFGWAVYFFIESLVRDF